MRLGWVVLSHAVVDFLSFVIIPLMTLLEERASFTHEQGALLLAVGSISSGLIQPFVALISDRFDTRWLGTLGLVAAALAIGSVGFVHDFETLLCLQAIGAAGIGAYHPVAAAAAGHLSHARRARGISVFYAAGMFGSVSAGFAVPSLVRAAGITSLVWLMVPGLLMAGLLAWAAHSIPHRQPGAHAEHAALPDHLRRRRWIDVGLLYAGNAIRFTVNMMLVQLIIRWSEGRVLAAAGAESLDAALRMKATALNGPVQAAMAIGMGVTSLVIGLWMRPTAAKRTLVLVPLAGAGLIAAFPLAGPTWVAFALAVAAGIAYGGIVPITLTMAQGLLPHRTSLASALMLGGAWMLAAAGPPIAQRMHGKFGLAQSFWMVAGLLLVSVILTVPVRGPRSTEQGAV